MVERVLLAAPRGFCAGVERAIETVERALAIAGPPVYVRRQIVHNAHVVHSLERRGAVFVESELDAPPGATIVLSAHGVAPEVHENAAARGLAAIDATCPLVTKVHSEVRRYAQDGHTVVLVGHAGHDEVVGTMGEAPGAVALVETAEAAELLDVPDPERVAVVTQTTLSVDETEEIVSVLRRRFPALREPAQSDICYATTNRQLAVKRMLPEIDLLLVVGSANSSNSNRLAEVARAGGVEARLIEDAAAIDETWLDGCRTVGLTAGASTPEELVAGVCDWFRERGVRRVDGVEAPSEAVSFGLPVEVRRPRRPVARVLPGGNSPELTTPV